MDDDISRVKVLSIFEAHNINKLKDMLLWNQKFIGGNKDALLTRIIYGNIHRKI